MLAPVNHILPLTTIERERVLPVAGEVVAKLNKQVSPTDVIAEATWSREHVLVDIARALGISANAADRLILVKADDKIAGYLTFRDGTHAAQIGPGVALSDEAGRALADAALDCCASRAVFVDVPVDNGPAMQWAETKGLVVQRYFTRMRRGESVIDRPAQLWASSGPEKG